MIRGVRNAPIAVELSIAILIFVVAAVWGTSYWRASLRAGRQPAFYQQYFEPAVMVACGYGFRLAAVPIPALRDFLQLKRDAFSCSDIPPGTEMTERYLVQKAWMYLLDSVALAWRVLGISWSGLGPLFGVLFGAAIVAAYAIFRLGMGRVISVAGAAALTVSAVHLQNLPHLRDYAKAPFTLVLFALLGLLVSREMTLRRLLAVALAYGVTLGVGYGFRTDFLIDIPLFPLAVFLFLPGGVRRRLPAKLAAIGVCAVAFVAVAWPILTTVQQRGGCQWHAVLLGLTDGPTDALMVSRAPYAYGHQFSDDFVYAASTAFAVRTQPGVSHIEYCSHDYDVVTGRQVVALARVFPGDFVTRALASVIQIVQLPFRWFDQPLPGWWTGLYFARRIVLKPLRGWAVLPVALTLVGLMASSLRLGIFAILFLLYVGGYPSLQFDVRHYFHLEFITWWALGFVVHCGVTEWRAAGRDTRAAFADLRRRYDWARGVRITGAIGIGIVIGLWVCRGYQQVSATRLFQTYVDAPKQPVAAAADGALHRIDLGRTQSDPNPAELLEVDLDAERCAPASSILFAYDRPYGSFSNVRPLAERSSGPEPTRVFAPVYAGFAGVQLSGMSPACLKGISRVDVPGDVSLLLPVTLPPSWRRHAMFEQMAPLRWRW